MRDPIEGIDYVHCADCGEYHDLDDGEMDGGEAFPGSTTADRVEGEWYCRDQAACAHRQEAEVA